MFIFLFILFVGIGAFFVFRLLNPNMYLPWKRSKLLSQAVAVPVNELDISYELPEFIDLPLQENELPDTFVNKINKLEALLLEKNSMIHRIQIELEAERAHRHEFEKVKSIMDEEISRLKEKNKILKGQKESIHA